MATKTRSRRPRHEPQQATPNLYARVLEHALEHPTIDEEGCVGFEVKPFLGRDPISKVGLPCRLNRRNVLTLKDMVALVGRLRRLTQKGRLSLE